VLAIILAFFLTGCVRFPVQNSPDVQKSSAAEIKLPAHISVLPPLNRTPSADGRILLRAFVVRKLGRDLGYLVQDADQTDAILSSQMPQDSQMPLALYAEKEDNSRLASILGAEGLLHSELLECAKSSLTIYSETKVKARFWLTDAQGKKIWETEKHFETGGLGSGRASPASSLSDSQLPSDVMERVRHSDVADPLLQVVEEAFQNVARCY
jgi:hypothetical protein